MPSNDLNVARAVFLQLLINGENVAGVLEAEASTTDHRTAGWFRVTVALGADPVFTPAALASMTEATAQISVGLAPSGMPPSAAAWQSLIIGTIDTVTLDMMAGVAQLNGRDFTALLIDTLSAETFSNNTASEIAQTLALRHGLAPTVTETTTPIGRYYQEGHDLSSLYQASRKATEWDFLSSLAEIEGFDVYVQGESLFFVPPAVAVAPTLWQWMPGGIAASTISTLQMEHSLALARDLVVTVQSWNSRQAQMITQTARASSQGAVDAGAAAASATATTYVLVRPNLTPQQAMTLATQTLSDLSRHERVITATLPGELDLAPRAWVQLQGTNTEFDQLYSVDEIVRRISLRGGFEETVRAVNTPVSAAA